MKKNNISKVPDSLKAMTKMSDSLKAMTKVPDSLKVMTKVPGIGKSIFPDHLKNITAMQDNWTSILLKQSHKFDFVRFSFPDFNIIKSELFDPLYKISSFYENLKRNPEFQFMSIADLEKSPKELKETLTSDLQEYYLEEKENLLNEELLPYLIELNIDALWIGANEVLKMESNPDKIRQCLVSLRTILEYLIDIELAPMDKLKDEKMFESKFRKYKDRKQKLEYVKIKREEKIEYFISKIEPGILEDFTKQSINYICACYSVLCNLHQVNVGITESQLRILKVKTGITIWLLAYINKIIKSGDCLGQI